MFRYRETILQQLARFGVFPRSHTPPELPRDFLKALYTLEVRRERIRQQERERLEERPDLSGYTQRIVELRQVYSVLSVPLEWWTERTASE